MKIAYTYRNKEKYEKHLRELILKGFNFPSRKNIESYLEYYYEYDDFLLLIDFDIKELTYGSESYTACETKEYDAKRSNIDNY